MSKLAICFTDYNQKFNSATSLQVSHWLHLLQPLERFGNWSVHANKLAPPGSYVDTTPYLSFIRHLNERFIIFTDGSATAGTLIGGSGMVATEGDPNNATTLLMKQQLGAAITSSYDEEKAKMRMAFECRLPSHTTAAICADSQSRPYVILGGFFDISDLKRMLNKRTGKANPLCVPGHHGVAGNEKGYACAKQAVAIADHTPQQVSFTAVNALIHRTLTGYLQVA